MTTPNDPQQPQQPQQPANVERVVYVEKQKAPWYKRPGCLIPLVLVIIALFFFVSCTAVFTKSANDVFEDMDREYEVTYSIEGDVQDGSATYNVGETNTAQDTSVQSGWSKTVTVTGMFGAYLNASNGINDEGTIICKVTANGKVISQNEGSGAFASASCSPSSAELKAAFNE